MLCHNAAERNCVMESSSLCNQTLQSGLLPVDQQCAVATMTFYFIPHICCLYIVFVNSMCVLPLLLDIKQLKY